MSVKIYISSVWDPLATLVLIGWSYAIDATGELFPEPTGLTTGNAYFDLQDKTGKVWRFTPDLTGALIPSDPTLSLGLGPTFKIFLENGNQWLKGVDTTGALTKQQIQL